MSNTHTPKVNLAPPNEADEGTAAPHGRYLQPVPTNRLPPEIVNVDHDHVCCSGNGGALGHPLVWLTLDQHSGFVDCGYCDRRFVMTGKAKAGH